MKRTVSIIITVDSETAEVTYLNMSEESRDNFLIKGIDKPISVCNTVNEIYNFLGDLIDIE